MTTQSGHGFGLVQPDSRPVADRLYRLYEDYEYSWVHADVLHRLAIGAGFEYDGASAGRIVWTLTGLRPDGLIRAAALAHDDIYEYEGDLPAGQHCVWEDDHGWVQVQHKWSRRDADRMFARLMREAGVSKLKRRIAYLAVRVGGWLYWREW